MSMAMRQGGQPLHSKSFSSACGPELLELSSNYQSQQPSLLPRVAVTQTLNFVHPLLGSCCTAGVHLHWMHGMLLKQFTSGEKANEKANLTCLDIRLLEAVLEKKA